LANARVYLDWVSVVMSLEMAWPYLKYNPIHLVGL